LGGSRVPGKPYFMPPEQFCPELRVQYGIPGDVFYLGSILVCLLWGELVNPKKESNLFCRGKTALDFIQKAFRKHQSLMMSEKQQERELPGAFIKLLKKMIHPDLESRHQRFSHLSRDLATLIESDEKNPWEKDITVCSKCGFFALPSQQMCPICTTPNTLKSLSVKSHTDKLDIFGDADRGTALDSNAFDDEVKFMPSTEAKASFAKRQSPPPKNRPSSKPEDPIPPAKPVHPEYEYDIPDASGYGTNDAWTNEPIGEDHEESNRPDNFVRLPAGKYPIGCSDDMIRTLTHRFSRINLDSSFVDTISKFKFRFTHLTKDCFMGKHPVTNREYLEFVKAVGYARQPKHWNMSENPPYGAGYELYPVVNVSYSDANAYCRWAGCRLPSDDEWEAMARGSGGSIYPWGNEYNENLCNSSESPHGEVIPVDELDGLEKSAMGCSQMTGNIWEWTNPIEIGHAKVRGGGFNSDCSLPALTFWDGMPVNADHTQNDISFRVAVASDPGETSGSIIVKDHVLVRIPQGPFIQGCPPESAGMVREIGERLGYEFDDLSSKEVDVPAFYISKYPVTNKDFLAFVEQTQHRRPSHWLRRKPFPDARGRHPVVNVSFNDARKYAGWLGPNFRVSPGLWWEKAARGTDGRLYPWGNQFDPTRCHCNESHASNLTSVDEHPMGKSPYGVCQMTGNAWELVDSIRHLRGGSYKYSCEIYGLTPFIMDCDANTLSDDTGFRCVTTINRR